MNLRRHLLLSTLLLMPCLAPAQVTTFTYQGRLNNNGTPAHGLYDLRFSLYDSLVGGGLRGGPIVMAPVPVSNGLFTVTLNFGGAFSTVDSPTLAIEVRTNGSAGSYTPLTPRQLVTPSPYAVRAFNADTASTVAANGVNNAALQNNALTFDKFAVGVMHPSNFPPNSVTSAHLADAVALGASNAPGRLDVFRTAAGTPALSLMGSSSQLSTYGADGLEQIRLWGAGWGEVLLFNSLSNNAQTVTLSANAGEGGYLTLANSNGAARAFLMGANSGGLLALRDPAHVETVRLGSAGASWLNGGPVGIGKSTAGHALDVGGNASVDGSLAVDALSLNVSGLFSPGLIFGGFGSGESISSQRGDTGPSRWGLDFFTGFTKRMSIANSGSVGIGTATPEDALLDVEGPLRMNDQNIYLRTASDRNHGLGHRGTVAGHGIDGPFLFGFNGGALGVAGPDSVSLSWDWVGNVWISNQLNTASLNVRGEATVKVLNITGGADIAEPFQMTRAQEIPKGAVVVIDEENPGHLKMSDSAYDTRVAGIVSGANGINPGLALHQQGVLDGGQNVALTGRVYALADASSVPIKPGDLLTTSATPGHVMKVSDRERGSGAILGKAMTSLKVGKGMVLVLVSLQ